MQPDPIHGQAAKRARTQTHPANSRARNWPGACACVLHKRMRIKFAYALYWLVYGRIWESFVSNLDWILVQVNS